MDSLTIKIKEIQTSEMSGTTHPMTLQHIPEDINIPQHYHCDSFESHLVQCCPSAAKGYSFNQGIYCGPNREEKEWVVKR
jgi:hypothetical protein